VIAIHAFMYGVLALFVLIGVVGSVYALLLLMTRPKSSGHFLVVIPNMSSESDVASLLCAARLRVGILGEFAHSDIIALDCGLSERRRLQCDLLCAKLEHTSLLTAEEFLDKVNTLSSL